MLFARKLANLGVGGPALCSALEAELGDGGSRRSRRAGSLVRSIARGGDAPREPAARALAHAGPAAEPLLPEQPPLPQSALPPHRGRARSRSLGAPARAARQRGART